MHSDWSQRVKQLSIKQHDAEMTKRHKNTIKTETTTATTSNWVTHRWHDTTRHDTTPTAKHRQITYVSG